MPHPFAMRRTWVLGVASLPVLATGVFALWIMHGRRQAPVVAPPAATEAPPSIAHLERAPAAVEEETLPPEPPPLAGLDLAHIATDDTGAFAPAGEGVARLTVDPEMQHIAAGLLSAHHFPEASIVLMDVGTGRILAYASHIEGQPARDLCVEATAPSASVFKIVTAAALVEDAHVAPDAKYCYSGGEQRIGAADLEENRARDRWCTTLGGALGRSINTVFARLAKQDLTPPKLESMARRFGYGRPLPFDVPVQQSGLHVPAEPLEFARTAAGFWNTTLSPLAAVELSAIIARGGETVRPEIVDKVVSGSGAVSWTPPESPPPRRAVAKETADQVTTMMERTVAEGTSWRAFHDIRGLSYLPGIAVAGKTGTLTEAETQKYYTWFTGFAPAHASAEIRQVAVAVLVVNGPNWQLKANVVAREMLRGYFAVKGAQGVTKPSLSVVARRRRNKA